MTETTQSFADQIERRAKDLEKVSTTTTTLEHDDSSVLVIRQRGCFVADCILAEPISGDATSVLHSDWDLTTSKLTASHVMSPVGSTEGLGGRHGFPRWADYKEFTQRDGPKGEKRTSFQAKRSDLGLGLIKTFELTESSLASSTTLLNSETEATHTSLGEHYYFTLKNEDSSGLTVNGKSLNELLGDGAEEKIMAGDAIFWPLFEGSVVINFPVGHSVKLSASAEGADESKLGMLFWHKPGSESICFEPTLGYDEDGQNNGLSIDPYQSITLNTKIELLPNNSPAELKERELKSRGAGVIFYIEETDELMFFLRDNKPNISCPGMIDIIGGHMEDGEEPGETALREVAEELVNRATGQPFELQPGDIKHFKTFVDDRPGEHNIFVCRLANTPDLYTLEGQGLVRLSREQARRTNFAYGYSEVVQEYLNTL